VDLELTDEQQSIVDVFGALADRWAPPAGLREHEALGFDPKVWEQLVATGAPGMALSEADGGGAATLLDLALAVEALGCRLTPAPLVEHAVAARLLARVGALTPEVTEGTTIAAIALRPAVDGRARLVPAGAVAGTVVALDDDRLVCATGAASGVAVPNLGDLPLADRDLAGADTETVVLATGDDARALHALALHEWRALTAAALVGLAAGALEIARVYVLEREQFDVQIGSFQSIQHSLADTKVGIDGAQLLAYKAAWSFTEQPARGPELATMALHFAAEQARVASERGLHFHGGYGVMVEYDIQLFYRRAKGWSLVLADPRSELHHLADLRYGLIDGKPVAGQGTA
jgi:alkylation response protein AidB-like acyl-CoA dehydrogenase